MTEPKPYFAQCIQEPAFRTSGVSTHSVSFASTSTLPALRRDVADIYCLNILANIGEPFSKFSSTFWVGAATAGSKQRTLIEEVVAEICVYHMATCRTSFNPERSGAEWWVQHQQITNSQAELYNVKEQSMSWHWDNDEMLYRTHDSMIHPWLATVTYLSQHGAPTCIFEQQCTSDSDALPPASPDAASRPPRFYISHPKYGKQICFDGRLLHCVPAELMDTASNAAAASGKEERMTLLVNIWLDYHPQGCLELSRALTRSMNVKQMDKLTPSNNKTSCCLAPDVSPIHEIDNAVDDTENFLPMDEIYFGYADRVSFCRVPTASISERDGIIMGTLFDMKWDAYVPSIDLACCDVAAWIDHGDKLCGPEVRRPDAAVHSYEQAIRLEPSNMEPRACLDRLFGHFVIQ